MAENIRVSCRIREAACPDWLRMHGRVLETCDPSTSSSSTYKFDAIFPPEASQETVYKEAAQRVVDGLKDGLNGTIFAYGQTGSGKTHTIMGPSMAAKIVDILPHDLGIIPRAIEQLFNFINARASENFCAKVEISYVQLYKEVWFDLLGYREKLQLRGNGLTSQKFEVSSVEEAYKLIQTGWANRVIAETHMNRTSSRSHCIFIIELTTRELVDELIQTRSARLNIVDLAGSERLAQTGVAVGSEQFKEGVAINLSLTTLSNVIRTLAQQQKHVNFRDSQLTQFLSDSLGGNARTSIVVTVHGDKEYITNTNATLQFATQCRSIKNICSVNMHITGESVVALKNKVNQLNAELQRTELQLKLDLEREYAPIKEELSSLRQKQLESAVQVEELQTKLRLELESKVAHSVTAKQRTPLANIQKRRRQTMHASAEVVQRSVAARKLTLFDENGEPHSPVMEHLNVAEQTLFEDEVPEDADLVRNQLNQLIEQRDTELVALRTEAAALKNALKYAKADAESQATRFANEIERLETTLKEKICYLEQQLAGAASDNAKLQLQIEHVNAENSKQIAEKDRLVSDLERRLSDSEAAFEKRLFSGERAADETRTQLNSALRQIDDLDLLLRTSQTASAQLETTLEKLAHVENQLVLKTQEAATARAELESATNALENLEKEYVEGKLQLVQKLQSNEAAMKQLNEKLELQIAQRDTKLQQAEAEIAALKKELEAQAAHKQQLEASCATRSDQIVQEQAARISQLEAQVNTLNQTLADTKEHERAKIAELRERHDKNMKFLADEVVAKTSKQFEEEYVKRKEALCEAHAKNLEALKVQLTQQNKKDVENCLRVQDALVKEPAKLELEALEKHMYAKEEELQKLRQEVATLKGSAPPNKRVTRSRSVLATTIEEADESKEPSTSLARPVRRCRKNL